VWHVDPLLGNDRELTNYATEAAALQTTAVVGQWLGSNHVGTITDTKATMAQKQMNGVFCAVSAGTV
jgi:hypothetical protein